MESAEEQEPVYFVSTLCSDEIETAAELIEGQIINEQICGNQTVLNYDNVQVVILGENSSDQYIQIKQEIENEIRNQCHDQGDEVCYQTFLLEERNPEECQNNDTNLCQSLVTNTTECEQEEEVSNHGKAENFEAAYENPSCSENCSSDMESCHTVQDDNKIESTECDILSSVEETEDIVADDKVENKYFCEPCNKHYTDFVSWCDHRRIIHEVTTENLNADSKLKQRSSTEQQENMKDGGVSKGCAIISKDPNRPVTTLKSRWACPSCEKVYSSRAGKNRHLRAHHKIFAKKPEPITKCLECNIEYEDKEELRNHLQLKHNMNMTPMTMHFPKMEAFLSWKSDMERETLSYYHKKSSAKGWLRYICQRSGKNYTIRKCKDNEILHRMERLRKSVKLGFVCTSEVSCKQNENGVIAKYYPVHYGHGNELAIAQLSPEEQAAIDEMTSKGVSLEKLLNDLKGGEVVDVTHMFPLKKRYLKWVKHGYATQEYNYEMNDAECVSQWVQQCSQMEECPILLCHQENIGCEKENFVLVIMTEFQKHILMSASKEIICVDVILRTSDAHLISVLVIDELSTAFPVAFCITNRVNKDVMTQFFTCMKESTGSLSPKYLMSNQKPDIYKSWVEVMGYSPLWLWSRWQVSCVMKTKLRTNVKGIDAERCELYNTMQAILDCRSEDIFACMFRNFVSNLQSQEKFKKVGDWMMKMLGSDTEKWANCYRKEISFQTNLHLEMMHHTLFSCGRWGKKKRLYTFLSVLMKVLKHKILDRILNSFDKEKLSLAVNAINLCHSKGLNIPPEKITSLSDKLWKIESEDSEKVYVAREVEKCPDHCSLVCVECNICVHQYSCSCVHSMIEANLCMHIHAVVFKFVDIHKRPPSPPLNEDLIREDSLSKGEDNTLVEDDHPIEPKAGSSLPLTLTSQLQPSYLKQTSSQSETNVLKNHFVSSGIPVSSRTSKSLSLREIMKDKSLSLQEITLYNINELYRSIQLRKLNEESLVGIIKHLSICRSIVNSNKSEYASASAVPVNIAGTIKQEQVSDVVSSPKQSYKRPCLSDTNSRTKLQKANNLTYYPHMLVITNDKVVQK